jgi:hypothetical protein
LATPAAPPARVSRLCRQEGLAQLTWSKRFVPAIPLPDGGQLETLHDSRAYILRLSAEKVQEPRWHTALELVLRVGNEGGIEMMVRIAMMQALYPAGGRVFRDTPLKGHKWKKVKLLRDR